MRLRIISKRKEQDLAMNFPYQEEAKGTEFVVEYFNSIMQDKDIKKVWLKNNCLLQVFIKKPDIDIHADTRNNQIKIYQGILEEEKPDLTLILKADHFHQIYPGKRNVKNAKKITENFKNIVFRFAIIPGINDKKENIAKISHFIKEKNRNEVHLIPYHKLSHDKYRILGITPPDAHIKLIDQEMINTVKRRFMKEGVTPILIE